MNQPIEKFLNISSPILITGETGTGKSFIAKEIFERSSINKEKFLTVHLASLKEDLLESELFGHVKGAFTGASENKQGYLKDVGAGTLFLDEVGELSLEAQKKLLYLLEEKKFTPVGSTAARDFKGRIIMATNKSLKDLMEKGLFREDLFYRLSLFRLEQKPLRENIKLLEKLMDVFLNELKEKYCKPQLFLNDKIKNNLLSHKWKGNVRELKNCLEYAVAMSDGRQLSYQDLPNFLLIENSFQKPSSDSEFLSQFPDDFGKSLELFERLYLKERLLKFSGRINETSKILGMSKTTLIYKAKKYQLNTLRMRADAFEFEQSA